MFRLWQDSTGGKKGGKGQISLEGKRRWEGDDEVMMKCEDENKGGGEDEAGGKPGMRLRR